MRRRIKLRAGVLRFMIMHYGYSDGSGDYYITFDTDKCNGCGKCVKICPQSAIQLETLFIDLEDKVVASLTEVQRKKIKYTCSPCKPEKNNAPCVIACESKAVKCTWNPN
jgi:Fe-S-cluster-containing hydrogenase component 2